MTYLHRDSRNCNLFVRHLQLHVEHKKSHLWALICTHLRPCFCSGSCWIFHDVQAVDTRQTCFFSDTSTTQWRRCSDRVNLADWVYISLQCSSLPISCERLWQVALLWQHAPIFLHNAKSIRNGAQIASSDPELQENGSIMVWIPCRQKRVGFQWRVQAASDFCATYKITHTRTHTLHKSLHTA